MNNALNVTFEDIGLAFKNNGYITTNNKCKQYNKSSKQFDDVNELDVLTIFEKVYPNFERRQLTLDLILSYFPEITSEEFEVYDLHKQIESEGKENILSSIDSQIKDITLENDKRKDKSVNEFKSSDFKSALQILINHDVFTDGNNFYLFKKNDFELLENTNESNNLDKILDSHCIKHHGGAIDYSTLIYQAKNELTNIRAIKTQIKLRNQILNISKEDMKAVRKIEDLIKIYEGDKDGF